MGILTFRHCDVKMTSYIKIFYEFEFKRLGVFMKRPEVCMEAVKERA